jgi:asparagine synthase (glutamine-hydrolysing)
MCGIAGFNFNNKLLISLMNDALKHRGPDGEGIYTDESVSLGHRRLSVIDLSEQANQPMFYKQYIIVFNGEIFNYREIKEKLISKNHQFENQSDTEVILHAYEEWGVNCLNHFNGMWAFCIYDKDKQELFLTRDRFGIKPLYYCFDNEQFIFASEIKAIQCHTINLSIDKHALNHYFYQKYIGQGRTIFNEIKKLEESHYILFDIIDKQLKINKYYNLEEEIERVSNFSEKEKKYRISELIPDAVEKRLISDVPVGSFLSGGLDSSLISSIIAQKHPQFDVFTIGFTEKSFNELHFAKQVAENIGVYHHYQTLTIDEDLIFEVIGKIDEPFGDSSIIPTNLLSKITREKVTVSLSGDAGDELFGGYDTYLAYKLACYVPGFSIGLLKKLTRLFPASDKNLHFTFKIIKFINDWNNNIQIRHLNWMSQSSEVQRQKLLGTNFRPTSEISNLGNGKTLLSIQLNDIHNYLSNDILHKLDMASMAHSLEARVPFLDYRLVPLVLSLKENQKIKNFTTKYFLKHFSKSFLPKEIIYRKKTGFSVPLSLWFKQSTRIQQVISDISYYHHQLIDYEYIQLLLKEHIAGKIDHSRVLWLVFVFNLWYVGNDLSKKIA